MKRIPLTNDVCTFVDDEDYAELNKYTWFASLGNKNYRATRMVRLKNGKQTMEHLARKILKAPKGSKVFHIDGDSLNNRKSNLKIVYGKKR
jgi:hypothetical protein